MSKLRQLRKAKGLSQAKLAELIDASQSDIARLERGSRRLTADWIRRIATALDLRPADLLESHDPALGQSGHGPRMVAQSRDVIEIPVYGYALAGDDQCIYLVKNGRIGSVPSHPRQRGFADAFAAYVAGNSMLPRYRPGELIYALSDHAAGIGEDCVVELMGGFGFLKEYRARTAVEIVCWQHHPPREWRRSLDEVVAVHLVIGRG